MKKMNSVILVLLMLLLLCAPAGLAAERVDPQQEVAEQELVSETPTVPETPDVAEVPTAPAPSEADDLAARWYGWKYPRDVGDSPTYDKAFRQFYAADPEVVIVNHVVYVKETHRVRENKQWVNKTQYNIVDFFDTDEAEAKTTALKLPATIDGSPVGISMSQQSDFSAGLFDGGYTNDTLKKLVLADGWQTIPAYAFSNFTALEKVGFPKSLTTVGVGAFQGCTALYKVCAGGGVKTVMSSAFAGCRSLRYFSYMERLQIIEGSAFSGCAFKKVRLSGTAALSGGDEDHYSAYGAFANNPRLCSVDFSSGSSKKPLVIGDGTFDGCSALALVILPKKGSVVIEDRAFKNCAKLAGMVNDSSVTEIGSCAFENCTALSAFTVSLDARAIREDAFKGCTALSKLTILSRNTALFDGQDNFLKAVPETCKVIVRTAKMKQAVLATGFQGSVKVQVPLAAPKKIAAKQKGDGVLIAWSAVAKATGYRVYRLDLATGETVPVKTVKGATKALLYPKTSDKYTFVVKAFRIIAGDVSWSDRTPDVATVQYQK